MNLVCRYFAFELCAANLTNWAKGQYTGPIPPHWVGMHQLASGLKFVHDQRFVHRDICPGNVLISVGGHRLVVSDFGLCKQVHDGSAGSFSASQHHGQHKWLAPERWEKKEDPNYRVTIASDIWALGCVYYYFITKGIHPFHHLSDFKMQMEVLDGKFNLSSKSSISAHPLPRLISRYLHLICRTTNWARRTYFNYQNG